MELNTPCRVYLALLTFGNPCHPSTFTVIRTVEPVKHSFFPRSPTVSAAQLVVLLTLCVTWRVIADQKIMDGCRTDRYAVDFDDLVADFESLALPRGASQYEFVDCALLEENTEGCALIGDVYAHFEN